MILKFFKFVIKGSMKNMQLIYAQEEDDITFQ